VQDSSWSPTGKGLESEDSCLISAALQETASQFY